MNTDWAILRGLVTSVTTRADLDQIVAALRDSRRTQRIADILETFAHAPVAEEKPPVRDARHRVVSASLEGQARALVRLFRDDLHMTNSQVEHWLHGNFPIRRTVGKDSLISYLARVLRWSEPGLAARIMQTMRNEIAHSGAIRPDIREFADRLDDHYRTRG